MNLELGLSANEVSKDFFFYSEFCGIPQFFCFKVCRGMHTATFIISGVLQLRFKQHKRPMFLKC